MELQPTPSLINLLFDSIALYLGYTLVTAAVLEMSVPRLKHKLVLLPIAFGLVTLVLHFKGMVL